MKKQKINIVAYPDKDSDLWFSFDKKEFELIISANDLLAKQNEELKHQLAEKDKKIEELKDLVDIWKTKLCEKMETQLLSVTKEKEQQIRHQLCQEIRNKIKTCWTIDEFETELGTLFKSSFDNNKFEALLDQIEGEKE